MFELDSFKVRSLVLIIILLFSSLSLPLCRALGKKVVLFSLLQVCLLMVFVHAPTCKLSIRGDSRAANRARPSVCSSRVCAWSLCL